MLTFLVERLSHQFLRGGNGQHSHLPTQIAQDAIPLQLGFGDRAFTNFGGFCFGGRLYFLGSAYGTFSGLADDLACFRMCACQDRGSFLFSVCARLCCYTGILESLRDFLPASLKQVQERLINPRVQSQEYDGKRDDLNNEKTQVDSKCFHGNAPISTKRP